MSDTQPAGHAPRSAARDAVIAGDSPIRSAGIVGLGLIGGSLARDLAASGVRILAWDRDPEVLNGALDSGVVASGLDAALTNAHDLDVIILALPVDVAAEVLARTAHVLANVPIVTDVCSTKQSLARTAARLGLADRFIGGHPLAGDHRSGWAASRTGLFRDAIVYICPETSTPDPCVRALGDMWRAVGAIPEIIDAAAHDRQLAWTSHLPQVVATALVRALNGAGLHEALLGPGGRDMTRLAASSADMWTPIALDNAAALSDAMRGLEHELAALREALDGADEQGIRRFLEPHAGTRV